MRTCRFGLEYFISQDPREPRKTETTLDAECFSDRKQLRQGIPYTGDRSAEKTNWS